MSQKLYFIGAVAALSTLAGAACAQNAGGDWTGPYAGIQFGHGEFSGERALSGVDGNDRVFGLHIGYLHDYGGWVSGVEIDHDQTSIDIAGFAKIDDITRLKLKAGLDIGRWLPYGTAGTTRVNTSVGDDTGSFYGFGLSYLATDSFVIGAEYLQHDFDELGGQLGLDTRASTFTIRASFRF